MSSPDRRLFCLSLLAVGACGFQPALAPGGGGALIQNRIRAADPTNRNEFDFVARLENRIGAGPGAPYRLIYSIQTERRGLAVTQAQEIARFNVLGELTYTVSDSDSGIALTQGRLESFTSYSATGTTVASLAAERDANRRLMIILADQLVTRLTATAPVWAS